MTVYRKQDMFSVEGIKHGDALLLMKRRIKCVFWIRKNIKNMGIFYGKEKKRKKKLCPKIK